MVKAKKPICAPAMERCTGAETETPAVLQDWPSGAVMQHRVEVRTKAPVRLPAFLSRRVIAPCSAPARQFTVGGRLVMSAVMCLRKPGWRGLREYHTRSVVVGAWWQA